MIVSIVIWSLLVCLVGVCSLARSYTTTIATHPDTTGRCGLDQYCRVQLLDASCQGFSSLSQLNHANCLSKYNKGQLLLDCSTNRLLNTGLETILNWFNYFPDLNTVQFGKFTGLDLDFFAPLRHADHLNISVGRYLTFAIYWSTLELYRSHENILTPAKCTCEVYDALLNAKNQVNVLSVFNAIFFSQVQFKNRICKYMFQNLTLYELSFKRYALEFVDNVPEPGLNTNITILSLNGFYRLDLTKKTMNRDVFRYTTEIHITKSTLFSIEEDLFKERFAYLRSILLDIYDLKAFVHGRGGVAWIKYLNGHIPTLRLDQTEPNTNLSLYIDQKALKLEISSSLFDKSLILPKFFPYQLYEFPDQDFCLFYDFPVSRLVFVQIDSLFKTTCTVSWLYRYQHLYVNTSLTTIELDSSIVCNFSQLVSNCRFLTEQQKGSLYSENPYFMFYNLGQGVKQTQTVLLTYMRPVVSLVCFIFNMLVVLTIVYNYKRRNQIKAQPKNKNQEIVLLEQTLYKYILLNSVFNALNAIVYSIDYFIPCEMLTGDDYDYPLPETCKTRTVFFSSIDSLLKLLSNFSFIQISINRYILVGKDHPGWIIKLSNITIKKFFFYTLFFTALLSSVNYFQIDFFSLSPIKKRSHFHHASEFAVIKDKLDGLSLLITLTSIHDLFSYFLYCLVSLLLDILTVRKLRAALLEKEKVASDKGKEAKKSRESERRSIIMVIANSLFNFLLRAPELISLIFYYIVLLQGFFLIRMFCFVYTACLVFVDIAQVFCVLSLCTPLIFYVKFNNVFKISFTVLIESILLGLRIKTLPAENKQNIDKQEAK